MYSCMHFEVRNKNVKQEARKKVDRDENSFQ